MNAIAFSLFGTHPIYTAGAIRNAELAAKVYPGWKVVMWVGTTVPKVTTMKLRQLGVDLRGPVEGIENEMFWRFLIADDASFERFIVRDLDSRLSKRESMAVQEWISSGLDWHSMRDHVHHTLPLGGGLWGGKTGLLNVKANIVKSKLATRPYKRSDSYSLDQTFLSRHVWPIAKLSCLEHDSCNRNIYTKARPFPTGCRFGDDRFCGEIFDATDIPDPVHWQQRVNFMS